MRKPEVIAPAGNLASLKAAVDNGADAVYLGFSDSTNARNFEGLNFTADELEDGIRYVRSKGRKFFVAINTFPQADAFPKWKKAVDMAIELTADAVIIANIGVLEYARKKYPDANLHLSTQASLSNFESINFYKKHFGIKRVSAAIVLTPGGWVGRVDLHVPRTRTFHCAVEPRFPTPETIAEAKRLITPELEEYIQVLLREFHALRARVSTFYSSYESDELYDDWAFDPREYDTAGLYCTEADCAGMEIELIEGDIENLTSIDLTVRTFACPRCGQFYYTQETREALEIRPGEPKSQPAWRQSFMKFWKTRK